MPTDTTQIQEPPVPQITALDDEHAPVGTVITADPATLPPELANITLPTIPETN